MKSKFGKLEEFVNSLELDIVKTDEQALLWVGGSGSSGINYYCTNRGDCDDTDNWKCTNDGC